MTAPSHVEARDLLGRALAAAAASQTLPVDEAEKLLSYIAAAEQTEQERDSFKDRAEYERRISDQCLRERDLAEARQKLAESTKDAAEAKWEVMYREELLRRLEFERLAAVLRDHSEAIRDGLNLALSEMPPSRVEDLRKAEAAAKAIAEALKT